MQLSHGSFFAYMFPARRSNLCDGAFGVLVFCVQQVHLVGINYLTNWFLGSLGSIDESALNNLGLVVNLTKHIHVSAHEVRPYCGFGVWCTRV